MHQTEKQCLSLLFRGTCVPLCQEVNDLLLLNQSVFATKKEDFPPSATLQGNFGESDDDP